MQEMIHGITFDMKTLRLLLVEDDRDDEFLAKVALKRVGLENVTVAHDGKMAVDMLFGSNRLNPDMILLDLRLPKIDGLQVLQKIREDASTKNIPVLIMTSSNDPGDKEFCINLGVVAILSKPLKEADLRSSLTLEIG
jgi:CheY-like chemotaxis protein